MSKQDQFNAEHQQPTPYGEDGDLYAFGDNVTADEAIEQLNKFWLETVGEDDRLPDTVSGYAYFTQMADGWKLDFNADNGDAKGLVLQLS